MDLPTLAFASLELSDIVTLVMTFSILVTGSSGYIGSHTVKLCKSKGAKVFGIDRVFPPKVLQRYFDGHLVEDISGSKVRGFLEKNKIDVVVHCAAKCLVAESVEKPDEYFDNNVTKANQFWSTCKESGIHRILFSSTAATYGEPIKSPIEEDHPQKPINPYGQTKLEFEKSLLADQQATENITIGILRYFNVAGADPEAEIGEDHHPETHLIPNIIRSMAQGAQITIFGSDYPTPDGTCIRDYVHVWDLADFHYRLASRMVFSDVGGVYNLGTTYGFSNLEVLKAAEKVLNKKASFQFAARRPGDPAILVADSKKAKRELEWEMTHSNLETIIETAYRWHQTLVGRGV